MIHFSELNLDKIAEEEYTLLHNKENFSTLDVFNKFFRWLKMHGIYSLYIKEVNKYFERGNVYMEENVYSFIYHRLKNSEDNIIDTSLYWDDTDQGHAFWSFFNWLYGMYCNKTFFTYSLDDIKEYLRVQGGEFYIKHYG